MARTLGDGLDFAVRSLALPWFLGLRWLTQDEPVSPEIPRPRLNASLAAKIAADELFLATEVVTASWVAMRDLPRILREMRAAIRFYRRRGWLEHPARYHASPPALRSPRLSATRAAGIEYTQLSFPSEYEPHPGEPGRERWLGYGPNRIAHAWLLRHRGPERPWVVCVPGYRMGSPMVDFTGFRVGWLHQELGLNVAIPVLPFHGPRTVGRRGGDGFLAGDFLDTVHAQTQAVWDVRRLIGWLRHQQAPALAAYGVSLGGYTAALVASLDARLDCVVAGIPAACFVDLARWNAPRILHGLVERLGFAWSDVEQLLRVVSPLALSPRVPRHRRFLFAAVADRLAPPHQARDLWQHWGRPRVAWYQGSHVSFLIEQEVASLLHEAFAETGVLPRKRPAARSARQAAPKSPPPRARAAARRAVL